MNDDVKHNPKRQAQPENASGHPSSVDQPWDRPYLVTVKKLGTIRYLAPNYANACDRARKAYGDDVLNVAEAPSPDDAQALAQQIIDDTLAAPSDDAFSPLVVPPQSIAPVIMLDGALTLGEPATVDENGAPPCGHTVPAVGCNYCHGCHVCEGPWPCPEHPLPERAKPNVEVIPPIVTRGDISRRAVAALSPAEQDALARIQSRAEPEPAPGDDGLPRLERLRQTFIARFNRMRTPPDVDGVDAHALVERLASYSDATLDDIHSVCPALVADLLVARELVAALRGTSDKPVDEEQS